MKNFINSQKRIVDEIIISDSNYKQACLSFVEKTLKYITNDNSDSMVLINNYIDDEILLNNLHQIRKRANDIKHEYDEIDFSENLALKSLEVLDEYLSYINKKYPDVIEVVNFKQLYIERKNNWLKEHSIEIEKIVTVEKEIPILKKEIITIEKPIIKEIVKDTNESSYNKDYMEIQLLNEENKKGLFINSLNIKSYKLALEILLKKFERNIRLSKDEEKVLLENLDEFYVHIIDFLPKYQLSNIFSTTTIIEFLNLEIKLNKKSLLLKYIKDEKYIDLEQSKMEIIIKQYIINNKKEALSIIIKYKNKFTPTNKMRKILSSTLELFELINIISDFENQSYLNTALFNKLNENYNIQTNKKLIDLLKLYPWGQKIICLEYILNEPKLITYDIFKECYRKINKSEINILILTNSKQRSLNIIKKLEKENIYLIDDLYKICSNKSCWSIEELIPSIASIIEFDNKYLSYKLVSPLIINYYIKNNQIQEQSLLKEILIDSLYNVNLERTNILLDKTEIDLTEDEMIDKIKEEISSNKQINVVYNALKKYGNVPISLLKSCFEYNFNLSCELFGDYLSKNLHIFDKYYTFSNNKKDYIFNYELVIKILTYLANVISEPYKLKKILYYGIKYYNSRWGKTNILISLIKIINEKGIYIYNIIPTFNDFFSNPNKYDRLSDLFENNTELINNLDLKHPIKLFSTNFILENIDSPNINIYLKHKSCSNSELVIEILRENDLKLIKKAFNIGIDFNVKCKQYWDRKSMSPLEYYKEHIYEQKNSIEQFLIIIELKNIIKKDINLLLVKDEQNLDYLDKLLLNKKNNKESLDFLHNNCDLKKLYSNVLDKKATKIDELRKKLYIDNNYLNTPKNYEELFSLNLNNLNKLNINSKAIIMMYDYYINKGDINKIQIITATNDQELKNHIKKQAEIKKANKIKKAKKKKRKASASELLYNLIVINIISLLFTCIDYGLVLLAAPYDIPWFADNIKLIIYIYILLVISCYVIGLCISKIEGLNKIKCSLIPAIGMFTLFIILDNSSYNNFMNGFEITNTKHTEFCTIITIKNINKTGSIDYHDISYGYEDLFLGSQNKIIYGNYKENEYITDKNINEVKKDCNIDYEINNLIVYSAIYETRMCGTEYNKYSCGGYNILTEWYIDKNVEYNLVFKINEPNNLYIRDYEIK